MNITTLLGARSPLSPPRLKDTRTCKIKLDQGLILPPPAARSARTFVINNLWISPSHPCRCFFYVPASFRYQRYKLGDVKGFDSLFFPEKAKLLEILQNFENKTGEREREGSCRSKTDFNLHRTHGLALAEPLSEAAPPFRRCPLLYTACLCPV